MHAIEANCFIARAVKILYFIKVNVKPIFNKLAATDNAVLPFAQLGHSNGLWSASCFSPKVSRDGGKVGVFRQLFRESP